MKNSQIGDTHCETTRMSRTSEDMRAVLLAQVEFDPITVTFTASIRRFKFVRIEDLPLEIKGYRARFEVGRENVLEFFVGDRARAVTVNKKLQNSASGPIKLQMARTRQSTGMPSSNLHRVSSAASRTR